MLGTEQNMSECQIALRRLVEKLEAVERNPSFQGIWPYLHVHGYKYTGPDWRQELADARLALTSAQDTRAKEGRSQ